MRVDLLGSIQKCICKARACSYLITGILKSRGTWKWVGGILLIFIFLQVFYFRPAFIFSAQLTFSISLLMQFFVPLHIPLCKEYYQAAIVISIMSSNDIPNYQECKFPNAFHASKQLNISKFPPHLLPPHPYEHVFLHWLSSFLLCAVGKHKWKAMVFKHGVEVASSVVVLISSRHSIIMGQVA